MWDSELPHLFVDLATLLDDLRIEGFHATAKRPSSSKMVKTTWLSSNSQ